MVQLRQLFLLGKLKTLGRNNVEDLENTGKRAREGEKKKENRFNRQADADVFCYARVHFVNNHVMTSYRDNSDGSERGRR